MSRYTQAKVEINSTGKRVYRQLRYPEIPLSETDIYIIATAGERLDILSFDYYNNTEDYWIIVAANQLRGDSLYLTPGSQVRIPTDIIPIKQEFLRINNLD